METTWSMFLRLLFISCVRKMNDTDHVRKVVIEVRVGSVDIGWTVVNLVCQNNNYGQRPAEIGTQRELCALNWYSFQTAIIMDQYNVTSYDDAPCAKLSRAQESGLPWQYSIP